MAAIHAARPEVPFNLLVYGNLVHAPGADAFCERIARAGASSLLVPDIPMEEAADLRTAVSAHGMGHVSLGRAEDERFEVAADRRTELGVSLPRRITRA